MLSSRLSKSMTAIANEISWSRKRKSALAGCPRKYFYQYYLKWEGWLDDAAPERRLAYRLSRMTSLPRIAGIAVHETIRRLIARAGRGLALNVVPEDLAAAIMKRTWIDARELRWMDRPKIHPPVFELYYQDGVPREDIVRWGALARTAVRAFADSDLFARIRASDPKGWLAIDDPLRFGDVPTTLDGDSRIWSRPDFAMRDGDRVTVYDWKTGARKDEDRVQLLAYALHAKHQWGFAPENITCVAVYLSGAVEEVPMPVTEAALDDVLATIRADLVRIRELDAQSADDANFPVDPRPEVCAWCEFQELCPAVNRTPQHRRGAPTQAAPGEEARA